MRGLLVLVMLSLIIGIALDAPSSPEIAVRVTDRVGDVNPGYLDIIYVELRIEYDTVRVIFKLREDVPKRPYVPQRRAIWYNIFFGTHTSCLLYTSPSPRDRG